MKDRVEVGRPQAEVRSYPYTHRSDATCSLKSGISVKTIGIIEFVLRID
jgi:hypothetical protein